MGANGCVQRLDLAEIFTTSTSKLKNDVKLASRHRKSEKIQKVSISTTCVFKKLTFYDIEKMNRPYQHDRNDRETMSWFR